MERNEIKSRVEEVFRDIMDNEDIVLNDNTTANDIEEWDSLTQIQLVVAIEKEFSIKFTAQEITNWKNVGEMLDCIAAK